MAALCWPRFEVPPTKCQRFIWNECNSNGCNRNANDWPKIRNCVARRQVTSSTPNCFGKRDNSNSSIHSIRWQFGFWKFVRNSETAVDRRQTMRMPSTAKICCRKFVRFCKAAKWWNFWVRPSIRWPICMLNWMCRWPNKVSPPYANRLSSWNCWNWLSMNMRRIFRSLHNVCRNINCINRWQSLLLRRWECDVCSCQFSELNSKSFFFFQRKFLSDSASSTATYDEHVVDILSAMELAEAALFGCPSIRRMLMARLALSMTDPMRQFPNDQLNRICRLFNSIEYLIQLKRTIDALTSSSFIYWHHEALFPTYLRSAFEPNTSNGYEQILVKFTINPIRRK